ncbi:MAG: 23S rRNA (guanosine(2251)-2'-O)-methyltransferase RlmB [Enterobacteriaceae bacterium PSpyr]|nr:MAG: 23S rRNA (guanosine(2251)-2'-O)-methyltransferase RlmB [Enterobacteriaceae bacterium PSpyr]
MKELIYGINPIKNLLYFSYKRFIKVFIYKNRNDLKINKIINNFKKKKIPIEFCNKKFFNKNFNSLVHQGIVAEIYKLKKYSEKDICNILKYFKNPIILVFDNITDPRNLGACIRSAYAAGVNIIIIPKKKTAKLNVLVKKTSCGACDNIPIIKVVNLFNILIFLKKININIIGTVCNYNNIFYKNNFNIPLVLIFGSENKGLKKKTKKICDKLISIPLFSNIKSLNVSVAVGIILFEIIRQRFF